MKCGTDKIKVIHLEYDPLDIWIHIKREHLWKYRETLKNLWPGRLSPNIVPQNVPQWGTLGTCFLYPTPHNGNVDTDDVDTDAYGEDNYDYFYRPLMK